MSDPLGLPLLPLSRPVLSGNESAYVTDAVQSGWVSTAGPYIELFEAKVREITGASFAVATMTGTSALHLALRAAGVGQDDLVIAPTLTFIATVNAARYIGAIPVLVGCDEYMNINVDAVVSFLEQQCDRDDEGLTRERRTRRVVRAIVPVHVFGNPCDMARLLAVAAEYDIPVVEDAAESIGSEWSAGALAGRSTGTVGHGGILSFNGNKIVTAGGGGVDLTQDERAAERVRHLSTVAKSDKVRFLYDDVGYNERMTNLPAALGLAQLELLPGFIETKKRNWALYADALNGIEGVRLLGVPEGTKPNYWFYSLIVEPDEFGMDREALLRYLDERAIQTRPVWGLIHEQPPYADALAWQTDSARWFWERVLNLPCSTDLCEADVERVVAAIRDAQRGVR
jgi:aminotransferase in exopolysaccharide biosynthesis